MAIVYLCLSLTHCWVGDCRHNVRKMGKYYFWLPFPLPSLFILCVCYLPGSELHARGFRKTKIQIWSHGTQFLLEEAGWTRTDYNLVKLNYMQFNKYYDNGISQDFGEQRTVHYCCPAGLRELSQRRWHLSWVLKDGQDFPLLGDTSIGNTSDRELQTSDRPQFPCCSKTAPEICVPWCKNMRTHVNTDAGDSLNSNIE